MKAGEVGGKGDLEGPRRIPPSEEHCSGSFSGPRRKPVAKWKLSGPPLGAQGNQCPPLRRFRLHRPPWEHQENMATARPPVATWLCLGSSQVTGAKGEMQGGNLNTSFAVPWKMPTKMC